MRSSKALISAFILVTIGLHAVPVLHYQGHPQTGWPVLTWAMYARSLPPGPIETTQRRIVAATASGARETVTPHLAGMSSTALRKTYLQPMWQGDTSAAQQLLHRLNSRRNDPLVEVWVEGEKLTLARGEVVQEALPMVTYRLEPSDSR